MASDRAFFAAHQDETLLVYPIHNAVDAPAEHLRFGQPVIQHMAVCVIKPVGIRAAAQLLAHILIADTPLLQRKAKVRRIEMAGIFRARIGADIHNETDFVLRQVGDEILQRDIGMSHSEDGSLNRVHKTSR